MIRSTLLAVFLLASLAQDKPGWQARLEAASRSPAAWKARRDEVRRQILVSVGLWPEFERPALKAEVYGKVDADDYSIERVTIETLPGLYLSGSLYRPKGKQPPFPGILSPHGHWKEGRFTQEKDGNLPARGITFARLGFVCFMYDMVGYADFKQLPHKFDDAAWGQGLMGLQTWNGLRAVDFMSSLPDVDPKRLGCTGASGGGTQTFILTAVDDRIACSAPVNMVAAEFQGGCSCENAPFLRLGLNNVEIAAMTAPRPLLLIAATGDWTKNIPTLEGPVLQKTFDALGVGERFRAVQFNAPHNYNQDSRETVYAWMARWLQNGHDAPRLAEPPVPPVKREELTVWTDDHKLPANAANAESLKTLLRDRVTAQLAALQPKDGASLNKYRLLMEPAWRVMVPAKTPALAAAPLVAADAVLVVAAKADDGAALVEALKGRTTHLLVLGPHAPEPTAGGDANQRKGYPTTFYRTELTRQVEDILRELGKLASQGRPPALRLVGLGDAALPVLLSRAVAGPSLQVAQTIVDLSAIDAAVDASKHPGLLRLGGWQGAATLAPAGALALYGKKFDADPLRASYKAAGREGALSVSAEAWTREQLLAELAK
ncbi:MAG: acetylxylan esterase [Planctomycetes bacterium]|nr:acetylxylan esterase [Planctomycetota bacterium]